MVFIPLVLFFAYSKLSVVKGNYLYEEHTKLQLLSQGGSIYHTQVFPRLTQLNSQKVSFKLNKSMTHHEVHA